MKKKSYYVIILFKEKGFPDSGERSVKMNDVNEKPHIKVRVKKSEPEAALSKKNAKNLMTIFFAMLALLQTQCHLLRMTSLPFSFQ